MTHIMEKYEDKVRALAEMELVAPRFRAFILRWEMNSQPAPVQSKPDANGIDALNATPESRKWGQGTNLEAEEESYFNGSDDEDEVPSATQSTVGASGSGSMWSIAPQQQQQPQQQQPQAQTQTPPRVGQRKSMRGTGRGGSGAASPQRTTRSSAAAAAAAAQNSPSSPGAAAGRPATPTPPHSPTPSGSGSGVIAVPQAYPMRGLLDYADDENDEELIGPMPAIIEEEILHERMKY